VDWVVNVKKGATVIWATAAGVDSNGQPLPRTSGRGVTIADVDGNNVLVAVESMGEVRHVIWCDTSLLTVVSE
jgi:hypothetical protein